MKTPSTSNLTSNWYVSNALQLCERAGYLPLLPATTELDGLLF